MSILSYPHAFFDPVSMSSWNCRMHELIPNINPGCIVVSILRACHLLTCWNVNCQHKIQDRIVKMLSHDNDTDGRKLMKRFLSNRDSASERTAVHGVVRAFSALLNWFFRHPIASACQSSPAEFDSCMDVHYGTSKGPRRNMQFPIIPPHTCIPGSTAPHCWSWRKN